jgi:phosphoglycolate phosphatase
LSRALQAASDASVMLSPPLIAFDLDGTLVDTAPDLIATLNAVFADKDIPPVDYHAAREMIGGGVKIMLERGLTAQGISFTPADLDALYSIYLDRYAAHIADRSQVFPGLVPALDVMSARGFRFAVCTNKLEWLSVRLLDALGLSSRFGAICGQDTFGIPKPDPEMLRRTIRRAGGDPACAVMVGDSATDINTARAAGIPVVAVDFGYTETPVPLLNPDRVISHFDELVAAIDDLLPMRGATASSA